MNITAYTKNNFYVVTLSSGNNKNRSPEILRGDGSSGRSHYCSRRNAFNRASAIIYCNQSILNTFVTLTYKNQHQNYQKILNDLKNNLSRKKISYIGVVEKHKSGNYHLHLLTSDLPNICSLRKGKYSWGDWKAGFSDVKFISSCDEKFRVELYMFKYMAKSEKIGGKYFLKSRDLTVKKHSYPFGTIPKPILYDYPIDFQTCNIYNGNEYKLTVERRYYCGGKTPNKTNF